MPVLYYFYLAMGSTMVGIVITFIVIFACAYFGIDITRHLWVLAIPVTLSVLLNVIFIEIYRKYRKR